MWIFLINYINILLLGLFVFLSYVSSLLYFVVWVCMLCCSCYGTYGCWISDFIKILLLLLLLLLSSSSTSSSPLCKVFILIFLRQTTKYIPRESSVAANLILLSMVLILLVPVLNLLHFYISTFRNICAVPYMAVFCSSLTSWFPGMLFMFFWMTLK